MSDYSRLTKAQLIDRLRQIERADVPPVLPEREGQAERRPSNCQQQVAARSQADSLVAPVRHLTRPAGELESVNQRLQAKVDEHKRSLEAIGESEARLRAILQTAIESIITIDEEGVIESINPAAERTFGYTAAELVGRNVSVLMPPPYRFEHDQYIQNYRSTGRPKVIGIGREAVGQRKDGSVFPIDLSVSEVRLLNRRLFTGFVRDITDRKRLEQRQKIRYTTTCALAESAGLEDAARKILDAVCHENDWIIGEFWCVDPDTSVIRFVDSHQLSGVELPEFVARAEQLCFAPGEGLPGRVWAQRKACWIADLTEEPLFARAIEAQKEGVQSALAFPILLPHEVHGVMVFFSRRRRDPDAELLQMFADMGSQVGQFIQRKRAEQRLAELARSLAEKNKELETVVYVASHDLRSPLVNVQGFSKELIRACDRVQSVLTRSGAAIDAELDAILHKEIPEAVEYIRASVAKMDTLLAGFLRFSRLGRAALQIRRLRMQSMLADIGRTIDFQIQQAKAQLRIEQAPDCMGDAMQINQVFSNLLDNALKYLDPTRPGEITVGGRVDGGRAIYWVRDNGIGIAPEHVERIFEIFHRLNPSKGEGEGLGLSIAQRSLERQNGKIWVESQLKTGSTFYVSLPTAPANPRSVEA